MPEARTRGCRSSRGGAGSGSHRSSNGTCLLFIPAPATGQSLESKCGRADSRARHVKQVVGPDGEGASGESRTERAPLDAGDHGSLSAGRDTVLELDGASACRWWGWGLDDVDDEEVCLPFGLLTGELGVASAGPLGRNTEVGPVQGLVGPPMVVDGHPKTAVSLSDRVQRSQGRPPNHRPSNPQRRLLVGLAAGAECLGHGGEGGLQLVALGRGLLGAVVASVSCCSAAGPVRGRGRLPGRAVRRGRRPRLSRPGGARSGGRPAGGRGHDHPYVRGPAMTWCNP